MVIKSQAASPQSNWMWIVALVFFATGAIGGFFLTSLPNLTLDDWFYWVSGRILWQLGGAIWFGATICAPLDVPRWKGAGLGALLGLVLCFIPLLDVVQGPQKLEGRVTDVLVWHDKIWRESGAYSITIHGQVKIETQEGKHQLELGGRQVNEWAERFRQCQEHSGAVHTVILRHLNVVLDVVCSS